MLWNEAECVASNRVCFSDGSILTDPEIDYCFCLIAGIPYEKEISVSRSYLIHFDKVFDQFGLNDL